MKKAYAILSVLATLSFGLGLVYVLTRKKKAAAIPVLPTGIGGQTPIPMPITTTITMPAQPAPPVRIINTGIAGGVITP